MYRFRHTVCTRLINNGVNPTAVMKILGEMNTDMVMRVYNSIHSGDMDTACVTHATQMDNLVLIGDRQ